MVKTQNTLTLEIIGEQDKKKSIRMKLLLGKKEFVEVYNDSTVLLKGLDKILKANKMGIASIQSFRVQPVGFESSLTTRTAEIILKTIQYFK